MLSRIRIPPCEINITQSAFVLSKLTTETLEQVVKHVQS